MSECRIPTVQNTIGERTQFSLDRLVRDAVIDGEDFEAARAVDNSLPIWIVRAWTSSPPMRSVTGSLSAIRSSSDAAAASARATRMGGGAISIRCSAQLPHRHRVILGSLPTGRG